MNSVDLVWLTSSWPQATMPPSLSPTGGTLCYRGQGRVRGGADKRLGGGAAVCQGQARNSHD